MLRGFGLLLVLVILLGVAYERGWFTAESHRGADQTDVTVTVQKDKIRSDEQAATQEAHDLGQRIENKIAPTRQPQG